MPVDNELYSRLSDTWWDESEPLGLLRTCLGPVRFSYFRRVLLDGQKRDPRALKVLDVGCGGGLLAEDFARLGCQVTGIDPSERSLSTAREHARQSALDIHYESGIGEALPFADSSFNVVLCCDVLEHVADLTAVVRESARVLSPGGVFFYETINRTLLSWFAAIQLAQEWKLTRFLPPNLHDWKQFVRPRELHRLMLQCHLHNRQLNGISVSANPCGLVAHFLRYKRAKITLAEMSQAVHLRESRNVSIVYMGHGVKC